MSFFTHFKNTEYTVSELNDIIKGYFKSNLSKIKVRGEISDIKKSQSGHIFFSLKDDGGIINVVCYKGMLVYLRQKIIEKLDVTVAGELTFYNSNCILKVTNIIPRGYGNLMQSIEDRKRRLSDMGIFNIEHKKDIPSSLNIDCVGVITSTGGAVIQDIIQRMHERFPKKILVYGVSVQGEYAASEIIEGINAFEALVDKPEVIIIARGGGSFEDLMPFNSEELVMEVHKAKIPIITAIGHEVDNTILDLVSDRRASTPTSAAEIVTTPTLKDTIIKIEQYQDRMSSLYSRKVFFLKELLNSQSRSIKGRISLSDYHRNLEILLLKMNSVCSYKINDNIQNIDKLHFYITEYSKRNIEQLTSKRKDLELNLVQNNNAIAKIESKLMLSTEIFNKVSKNILLEKMYTMQNQLHFYRSSINEKMNKYINKNSFLLQEKVFLLKKGNKNLMESMSKKMDSLDKYRLSKLCLSLYERLFLRISTLEKLFNNLDIKKTLKRGFAIVTHNKKIIKSINEIETKKEYNITLTDGTVNVQSRLSKTDKHSNTLITDPYSSNKK